MTGGPVLNMNRASNRLDPRAPQSWGRDWLRRCAPLGLLLPLLAGGCASVDANNTRAWPWNHPTQAEISQEWCDWSIGLFSWPGLGGYSRKDEPGNHHP
jgi:hypothetical protein